MPGGYGLLGGDVVAVQDILHGPRHSQALDRIGRFGPFDPTETQCQIGRA